MLGIAREMKDHAARFGAGRAARYFAWRVADRLTGYMPYQGFVLPASRARGRNAFAPNGFVCREVALQELAPCTSDSAYDLSERFLSDARARADCCIGVFAGEKLVSYSFNSTVPTNIDSGFRYEFPEGWVYHFKAFTLPEWRGQGLHGRQISAILSKFAGLAGFKGLTTLVVRTNDSSLASFARFYFEPVFRFAIVGKGEKRRVVADAVGKVHEADGKVSFLARSTRQAFAVAKLGASNDMP